MNLAEFHESVLRTALAQGEEKGALPLCCCVLTAYASRPHYFLELNATV